MLPRSLYEVLPYLYIATGLAGGLLVESSLIMIASMLLISAGLVTLYMRYQHRCPPGLKSSRTERRCGGDRRRQHLLSFPLIDNRGVVITSDRRIGDRRQQPEYG